MIALVYDPAAQRADFTRVDGGNIDTDEGLESAVVASLFTDARAKESDGLDKEQDPRGWWGEVHLSQPGSFGSRLWILRRNKLTSANLVLASGYAKEALTWLVDARVASDIQVTAQRMAGRNDVAIIAVNILRPRGAAPRFSRSWEMQFGL